MAITRKKRYTKKKRGNGDGTFNAKFDSRCWVCGETIFSGSRAKFDFSTGSKKVIHGDCTAEDRKANPKLPDWEPSDEQNAVNEYILGHLTQYVKNDVCDPLAVSVDALAGTGKTSLLELIFASVSLRNIYPPTLPWAQYLVFNTKNAAEAELKVDPMIATASTIHSFGFAQVKIHFPSMQRRAVPDKLSYIYRDNIFDFNALEYGDKLFLEHIKRFTKIKKIIEKCKNLCVRPGTEFFTRVDEIASFFDIPVPKEKDDPDFLADCEKVFTLSCEDTSRCDYDDMVYFLWYYDVKITLPHNIQFIGVDECQDQSPLRVWLIKKFVELRRHVLIVGDRYQAIMGFTGALTDSMDQAKAALGPNVKSFPLTINRRTDNLYIIEYVRDRYIPELKAHPGATYMGEVQEHEAEEFENILAGLRPGDAVLGRTNAPNIEIYLKLLESGRGATIQGSDNVEKIMSLFDYLAKTYDCSTVQDFMMLSHQWQDEQLAKAGRNQFKQAKIDDNAQSVRAICRGLEQNDRINDVQDLVRHMFSDINGDRMSIITLASTHKSKGLEWDRVFIIKTLDDKVMFPHPRIVNEELKIQELNLFYPVGCLRARKELHILSVNMKEE